MPAPEKLAPRKVKEGTLDLTAAIIFCRKADLHDEIVKLCDSVKIDLAGPFGKVSLASVMKMLLKNITPFVQLGKLDDISLHPMVPLGRFHLHL